MFIMKIKSKIDFFVYYNCKKYCKITIIPECIQRNVVEYVEYILETFQTEIKN